MVNKNIQVSGTQFHHSKASLFPSLFIHPKPSSISLYLPLPGNHYSGVHVHKPFLPFFSLLSQLNFIWNDGVLWRLLFEDKPILNCNYNLNLPLKNKISLVYKFTTSCQTGKTILFLWPCKVVSFLFPTRDIIDIKYCLSLRCAMHRFVTCWYCEILPQ